MARAAPGFVGLTVSRSVVTPTSAGALVPSTECAMTRIVSAVPDANGPSAADVVVVERVETTAPPCSAVTVQKSGVAPPETDQRTATEFIVGTASRPLGAFGAARSGDGIVTC